MKKHLIAMAALATLSSAAFAQSSATVYGFLDVGVFTTNNAGASGKSLTTMEQAGGNWFPSMYGITGTEDLGGGLKASFNLQGSLSLANGNNTDGTNNLFGRYASVKLSGAAGSVELGRQIDLLFLQSFINGVIPTHANSLAVNGLLAYGSTGSESSSVGNVFGSRINNAITYRTPTVNGIQAAFMYAPGGTAGSSSANALYTGLVTANVSGVALSAGYESQNNTTTNDVFHKSLVGAKYSVGAVDLAGQYHTYKSKTTIDTKAYELGVAYHVSPTLNVGVNYEHFSNDVLNTKPTVTSVKVKYDLSKRTYLYGMGARYNGAASTEIFQGYGVGVLANTSTVLGANKTATNFAVGVVHGF
jgi:predicted porin